MMSLVPAYRLLTGLCALALLAGCATTRNSSNAKPVLYPNATYERMGQSAALQVLDACAAKARAQGLSPSNGATVSNAGKGAATAGVMAAVGALVTGNADGAIKAGAQGAAVGAAGGAVHGAYEEQYNPVYRRFVEACASEQGLQVLDWN